jgi:carboxylesterase type B
MAVPDGSCRLTDPLRLSHINHRLNILGTLDPSADGAAHASSRQTGMADLVAALQWIHENIQVFGGDQGLFHKVVAQSEGGLSYRTTDPAASIKAQQMLAAVTLRNLGLNGSQIEQLKKIPCPSAEIAFVFHNLSEPHLRLAYPLSLGTARPRSLYRIERSLLPRRGLSLAAILTVSDAE